MDFNKQNGTIECVYCNTHLPEATKFCMKCGKPIETILPNTRQNTICTQCKSVLESGLKFCTKCGTKIGKSTIPTVSCPNCNAEYEPGLNFCTTCGTPLKSKKNNVNFTISDNPRNREASSKPRSSYDDSLNSVLDSGKDILNGLGGFLDKTVNEIDKNLNQTKKRGHGTPSKEISQLLNKRREKIKSKHGYLVCESCGGYYELQPGEVPDDYTDECDCGGRLQHQLKI